MDSNTRESTPVVRRETKNRISVDFEGKLTFKEKLLEKLKASNTWIKAVVNIFRFILMLGVSFVIIYPFVARIAGSFMTKADVLDATVSLIPKNPTLEIYKELIYRNRTSNKNLRLPFQNLGVRTPSKAQGLPFPFSRP